MINCFDPSKLNAYFFYAGYTDKNKFIRDTSNPSPPFIQKLNWIKILGLLMLVYFVTGCTGPPVVSDVSFEPNPNERVPLAGILKLTSDRPVVVQLSIDDGTNLQEVTPNEEPNTIHEVPVLGLRPGRSHSIIAVAQDERGKKTTIDTFTFVTPELPEDFPPITLAHPKSGTIEPGVTMINLFRWTGMFDDDSDWGMVVAVDEQGEVVWYLETDFGIGEARRMFNGNLILSGEVDSRVFEVDMLGNFLKEWHTSGVVLGELMEGSIPVETDAFHHDVIELSNGNFIGLGLEVIDFEEFPSEYPPGTATAPATVASDVLIEFDREGNTVHAWKVAEILDPRRLGDGALGNTFYEDLYKEKYDTIPMDITHSNAIYYIEEEDAVIVSSNFQCIVYKVDMGTGELKWILGDPVEWKEPWASKLLKPVGDLTWPCHQHGVEMTPEGNILLFDNGGARKVPPQEAMAVEDRFSRAVEYRVDEEAGTVEEVWSYGPEQERFVSPFISDADYLPVTGNVLITDGGRFLGQDGQPMNTFGGHQWCRVLEVSHDENPTKLWEVVIQDSIKRFSAYRAQRFLSLYPGIDRPTG